MTVPPRLELALLPTPILKLERLSRRLGIELYVKRDDLTGLLESGGEVRKLEFLAAEAPRSGRRHADHVWKASVQRVPGGGGRRGAPRVPRGDRGRGERPEGYDGNLLLGRMLGAEVRYLIDPEGRRAAGVLDDIAAQVRAGRPALPHSRGRGQ